jgi:hypothetical protein
MAPKQAQPMKMSAAPDAATAADAIRLAEVGKQRIQALMTANTAQTSTHNTATADADMTQPYTANTKEPTRKLSVDSADDPPAKTSRRSPSREEAPSDSAAPVQLQMEIESRAEEQSAKAERTELAFEAVLDSLQAQAAANSTPASGSADAQAAADYKLPSNTDQTLQTREDSTCCLRRPL